MGNLCKRLAIMAAFVSIPYPVLGGVLVTIVGVFVGVNLSNLKVIDLSSTRNLSIIGMALFIGMMVPAWMEDNRDAIQTGNREADEVLLMLLGNPNFIGCFLAFFLDNTVPGTKEERGITAWQMDVTGVKETSVTYIEGPEIYEVPLPRCCARRSWLYKLPIFSRE